MRLLDKLERKFGKYAIQNLMLYIVGINAFVYILGMFNPITTYLLQLHPRLVMQGEVWRLITFAFIPPASTPLFIFFVLYFYYLIGSTLEHEWGSFKFNIYYLIGILGTVAASFITGSPMVGYYLNLSLFFAFARLYPEFTIRLFFILPVKIKWLAWFSWAYFGYTIIFSPFLAIKISAVVAIINYFLFFGKDIVTRRRHSASAMYRKSKFKAGLVTKETYHKCQVCGRTEKDNPNLEFRYCSKCHGHHEYCIEHLHSHEHIKENIEEFENKEH